MKLRLVLLVFGFVLFGSFSAVALEGKVVKVADGDTFTMIDTDGNKVKVRFYAIDCPESDQAFGPEAGEFTSSFVLGKHVQVEVTDIGNYGRSIGIVFLEDGRNLNKMLLSEGLAWWNHEYNDEFEYAELEIGARQQLLGLWKSRTAIPPSAWRRLRGQLK